MTCGSASPGGFDLPVEVVGVVLLGKEHESIQEWTAKRAAKYDASDHRFYRHPSAWLISAAVALGIALLVTIFGNVPINFRTGRIDQDTAPEGFIVMRRRCPQRGSNPRPMD